jgi:alpha-galactosidase
MFSVPDLFLKRLYIRGSLHNAPEGCEFSLYNGVGSGILFRFYLLEVDGADYAIDCLVVVGAGGATRGAAAITREDPIYLTDGRPIHLRLAGLRLPDGEHTFRLGFETVEKGLLEISFTDMLQTERVPAVPEAPRVEPAPAVRPLKIAILGAGSTVFARQLMTDFLMTPGMEEGTFALVDLDDRRLELAHAIGEKLIGLRGERNWKVEATTNRVEALSGCDYVINTIEVAGLRNVRSDYDIPLGYHVDQCIGDTIGPGGIFKMLRTGPAWLAILRDVERLCPSAVVMNYTNPMSALTLLALRATRLQVVGLCHSAQGTAQQLARYLDVPYRELRWRCGGINHLAWYTELSWRGEDMYPRLRQVAQVPEIYDADPVRFEVMLHFGAFVTESSGHFSEYVPYFRKRPELVSQYTRAGYRGESGFYANNWPKWRAASDEMIRATLDGKAEVVLRRGHEWASYIAEALETGRPAVVHGNVLNTGLIENLLPGGCVEVPVLVDAAGLHPTHFGPLPTQLAALDSAHMYVHELMVEAVLQRSRQAALHALMLDPLTAAVCSPDEIEAMFDAMWEAEKEDLQEFCS